MIVKIVLISVIINCFFTSVCGLWVIPSINNFISRWTKDTKSPVVETLNGTKLKEHCDENQLMLQLARLYIISPERIILLLTMDTLKETCHDISVILQHINSTFSLCIPLPTNNLYVKLYDGLEYFYSFICEKAEISKTKHINEYRDCLKELREELIECEGPPDWFEKENQTVVCQFFNEIINCNYVKAAMLCGLTPALMLRNFSTELMKRVLLFKCQVSKSLPRVDDPMPSSGNDMKITIFYIFILIVFCCLDSIYFL